MTRALVAHPTPLRTPVVCLRHGFSTQDPGVRELGDKFATAPPLPAGDSQGEHTHTTSTPGSNDEVARLAAILLPTLTLQDLVRYMPQLF